VPSDYSFVIFIVWIIEAGVLLLLFTVVLGGMFVKNVIAPMAITYIESRRPIYNIRQDLLTDRENAKSILRTINFLRLSGLSYCYQHYLEQRKGVVSKSLAMMKLLWSPHPSHRKDRKLAPSTRKLATSQKRRKERSGSLNVSDELRAGHYKVNFLETVPLDETEPKRNNTLTNDAAIELEEVHHRDDSHVHDPGHVELDEQENYLLYLPAEVMVIILSYVLGREEVGGVPVASVYAYATRYTHVEEYTDATLFFAYFHLNTEFVQQLDGKSLEKVNDSFFPPLQSVLVKLESSSGSSFESSAESTSEI
jgi:hypothetical protein